MFESALLESSGQLHARARVATAVSFALQAILVAVLLALPLLHPALPHLASAPPALIAPVAPPPPPPTQRVHLDTTTSSARVALPAQPATVQPATVQPATVQPDAVMIPNTDAPSAALADGLAGSVSAITPGMAGSSFAHAMAMPPAAGSGTRIALAPETPANRRSISLSSGVSAGLLLAPITPVHPSIARSTHTQGTVVVHALISRDGRILAATMLSGNPLLQASALQAVREARYRPYLLNGQPTEVDTTFTIHFHMDD
jgi:protein TonB